MSAKTLNERVVCAFDPNDKLLVFPEGCGPENNIDKDEELIYQIRFQNVGNAPATNVLIRDVLDADLDLTTFKIVGSSHDITNIQIIPDNALIIIFDNILLPPEVSDPEGSNGFVAFSIKPKLNLPEGTRIDNQAAIYFDFNEAVITNTTMNTLRENPFPVAAFEVEHPCEVISNEFNFTYTGGTEDGATFLWEFGPNATPSTSTEQNPSGVVFSSSGERQVTLTVTRFGCMATVTATINIVNPVACQGEDHKVLVCHIPPGNPDNAQEICIDTHAVKAHINHGDCIGACGDPIISIDGYYEWDEEHQHNNFTNPFIKNNNTQQANKTNLEPQLIAYPNPVSNNTKIDYSIHKPSNITLSIYNIYGAEVIRLVDGEQQMAGNHSVELNTTDFPNGVYLTFLRAGGKINTYKLVIIK